MYLLHINNFPSFLSLCFFTFLNIEVSLKTLGSPYRILINAFIYPPFSLFDSDPDLWFFTGLAFEYDVLRWLYILHAQRQEFLVMFLAK